VLKVLSGKNLTKCGKKDGTERRKEGIYQIQKSIKITRLGGGHRREETVMTRLRLGHCALNKSL